MHQLASKDKYLNKDITFVTNTIIEEFDMKDAGLSLIREYNLLPKRDIDKLVELNEKKSDIDEKYGKKKATIKIGKYQRDNEKVNLGMKVGFQEARDKFLTTNDLDEMSIIAIKKDAIFVTQHPKYTKFGNYINFRCKNSYSGYMLVNDKIELYYYNKGFDMDGLDVKNMGEESIMVHEKYLIDFFKKFFRKTQSSSKKEVLTFLRLFIDKYKALKLKSEFYIEFKPQGKYVYKDGVTSGVEYRQNKSELDISYNYHILMDMIKVIL